jgi:hypothetical protein
MTILEAVQVERAKYGASPTADECVAIVNDAAYACRAQPEKWGISGKDFGDNGRRSDGRLCARDIVQNGVTLEIYDVLRAAGDGGPAEPVWQPKGVLNDPNRPYVAAIPPKDTPPVPPDPPDPPDPPTNYATAEQLAKHDADIKALISQTRLAAAATLVRLKTLELVGTAKIMGMTVNFTLKPKV